MCSVVYGLNNRNYEFNLSIVLNCCNNLMFYRSLNLWVHNIHTLKKKSVQATHIHIIIFQRHTYILFSFIFPRKIVDDGDDDYYIW
jgi:hypothetical protein